MKKLFLAMISAGFFLSAAPAFAQDPGREAHWGVAVDFTPTWKADDRLKIVFDDPETMDISGSEFRIGAAHGSMLGGTSEFVYVKKRIKDGSALEDAQGESCFGSFGCFPSSRKLVASGAYVDGFMANKFVSFGTIKRRVQLGITVGGGIGVVKGNVQKIETGSRFVLGPNNLIIGVVPEESNAILPATELIIEEIQYLPLAKLEFTVAGVIARGFKVKGSGGFDFPGTSKFTVGILYLIGAK